MKEGRGMEGKEGGKANKRKIFKNCVSPSASRITAVTESGRSAQAASASSSIPCGAGERHSSNIALNALTL